eukprot:scaffold24_cov245-Pinguiococcus_pyrenoidosus.AAC.17
MVGYLDRSSMPTKNKRAEIMEMMDHIRGGRRWRNPVKESLSLALFVCFPVVTPAGLPFSLSIYTKRSFPPVRRKEGGFRRSGWRLLLLLRRRRRLAAHWVALTDVDAPPALEATELCPVTEELRQGV